MRQIDGVIRKSLKDAVAYYGGFLGVSRRLGISHSTVVFWISGKTKHINSDLWRGRVYYLLEPFLRENLPESTAEEVHSRYFDSLFSECSGRMISDIPVIPASSLLSYEPMFESVISFATVNSRRKMNYLGECGRKYFAVSFDQSEFCICLSSSVLFVCQENERAKSEDFVLVKVAGCEKILVKRFRCDGKSVCLESLGDSAEDEFEWHMEEEKHGIEWMFPVVWLKVICRV